MPTAEVNGIQLFYEMQGDGDVAIVFVHGSWVNHHQWDAIVPALAGSFRVLTYDRRGHSRSERPAGQGSVREDVGDLAALIEGLGLAPAWVAGNSFGGSIALRLAAERPDLLRGVIAHEPPLFSLLANDPVAAPLLAEVRTRIEAVVQRIAAGDHAGAAEQFVETIALGPGSWAQLPADLQAVFVENAPTFLDEAHDPDLLAFDLEGIARFPRPALLTTGEVSPPAFAPVVATLVGALPNVKVVAYPGAGHVPHLTHPQAYVETITAFVRERRA